MHKDYATGQKIIDVNKLSEFNVNDRVEILPQQYDKVLGNNSPIQDLASVQLLKS